MATFNINQISEQVPLIKKIFTEKSRRQWLMEQTGNNIPTQRGIMNTVKAVHWRQMVLGEFYFFSYRPKHAKTLDYYDTFPLVIPRLSKTREQSIYGSVQFALPICGHTIIIARKGISF